MEHLRTFISIPLPEKISRSISYSFNNLPLDFDKLRLVDMNNLHITLKFLGDTRLEDLQKIISSLDDVLSEEDSLDIELSHGMCLPAHKPHALACNVLSNSQLNRLHDLIEKKLSTSGLTQPDRKKFSPHITLARVNKQNTITDAEIIAIQNWKTPLIWHADKVVLFESKLSATGPSYNILQTIHLA